MVIRILTLLVALVVSVSAQTISYQVTDQSLNKAVRNGDSMAGTCVIGGQTARTIQFSPLVPGVISLRVDPDGDGDADTGLACLLSRRTTVQVGGTGNPLAVGEWRMECALEGVVCVASTICADDDTCRPEVP